MAKKLFDANDVELIETVLDLVPDLDLVAYVAKIARKKLKYPIKDHEAFRPLFRSHAAAPFKNRAFAFDDLLEFIPQEFFPIETERDLMCRLLIALQRGHMAHLQEELIGAAAQRGKGGQGVTHLPSPASPAFGNYRRNAGFDTEKAK